MLRLSVIRWALCTVAIACSQLSCSHSSEGLEVCESPHAEPGAEWPTGTPAEHGLDANALQAAADYAADHGSRCLVVVRHGVLVGEWYWQDTTPTAAIPTWSLAKSYTSTLVGLAVQDGLIHSIDDPVSRYVPEWRGSDREAITIRHLLTMTSGLLFDQESDSVSFLVEKDMTQVALNLPLSDTPGSVWKYSNQAVQVLEAVLRNATGRNADAYAREKLWGPIGMTADWRKDEAGHPSTYMNVLTTCRDHARFGELFLRKGCWGSQRVVPSKWVAEATQPSTELSHAYGWLWWVNAGAPVLDSMGFAPLDRERYHPSAPADAFCASGLGNQMIEVIPSLDMVVVRTGFAPQEDPALDSDPLGQLTATLNDGKAIVHTAVLEQVLKAVVKQ